MTIYSHGERFGSLTILRRNPSGRYLCGCECGRRENYRARALLRVRQCSKCRTNRTSATNNESSTGAK